LTAAHNIFPKVQPGKKPIRISNFVFYAGHSSIEDEYSNGIAVTKMKYP
jgi:tetrahydromethanopterin S-methyltransferase subunit H